MSKHDDQINLTITSTTQFSLQHLSSFQNGQRSPKEICSFGTRHYSRENFKKTLFNEKPISMKISSKLKQSGESDQIDRHFSLDEDMLQASKSRQFNDVIMDSQQMAERRISASQGLADIVTQQTISKKNMNNFNIQKFGVNTPGMVMNMENKQKQIVTIDQIELKLSKSQHMSSENKTCGAFDSTTKGQIQWEINTPLSFINTDDQLIKKKRLQNMLQDKNPKGRNNQQAVFILNDNNLINSDMNAFVSSESAMNSPLPLSSQQLTYSNSMMIEQVEQVTLNRVISSGFFIILLGLIGSIACYSHDSEYILTFVSSNVYGLSYSLLLIYLISNHPFFKITNENSSVVFTTPRFVYLGIVLCLSSFYGFHFRNRILETTQFNIFHTLPFLSLLIFLIFACCISSGQPVLYKRLQMSFGNTLDHKLNFSQTKFVSKGLSRYRLPKNINNFLPDKQGPKISSLKVYICFVFILILLHTQVYYGLNQNRIWSDIIQKREHYLYLMILIFLILSEILSGIVYKIDSFFQLEFKYELEFVRTIFSVCIFRLFYLMIPSLSRGIAIVLIKLGFKCIMYYLFPIRYECFQIGALQRFILCSKKKVIPVEFTDLHRRYFTKKFGILQFTDIVSLFLNISIIIMFYALAETQDEYTRITSIEFRDILLLAILELLMEVILTYAITSLLAKNPKFKGLSALKMIHQVNNFLQEGRSIVFLAFLAVTSSIVISLANNCLSFTSFKQTYS